MLQRTLHIMNAQFFLAKYMMFPKLSKTKGKPSSKLYAGQEK